MTILYEPCGRCGGSGEEPTTPDAASEAGRAEPDICLVCEGRGAVPVETLAEGPSREGHLFWYNADDNGLYEVVAGSDGDIYWAHWSNTLDVRTGIRGGLRPAPYTIRQKGLRILNKETGSQ